MAGSFELFDHTADIGIRARGGSLAELAKAAADGLYAVIGDIAAGEAAEGRRFDITGDGPADILRDFLHELLVLFERGRIITSLEVDAFDDTHLAAEARTAAVDHEGSDFAREVKAITYHELEVRQTEEGVEATVIVDI